MMLLRAYSLRFALLLGIPIVLSTETQKGNDELRDELEKEQRELVQILRN